MTKSELIAQLARYKKDEELLVAYWDADWFRNLLRAELGELSDDEVDICMSAAEDVIELNNIGDFIISEAASEVIKHRKGE
jgi:hypothetical protein